MTIKMLFFSYSCKACDPAGPLFYPNLIFQALGAPSAAAKNVQTIHTSTDLGTLERNSHQDWLMGHCGSSQPGAPVEVTVVSGGKAVPNNHIMCPTFYVNAFDNIFAAAPNDGCGISLRDVSPVPSNYSMGYTQPNKGCVWETIN